MTSFVLGLAGTAIEFDILRYEESNQIFIARVHAEYALSPPLWTLLESSFIDGGVPSNLSRFRNALVFVTQLQGVSCRVDVHRCSPTLLHLAAPSREFDFRQYSPQ